MADTAEHFALLERALDQTEAVIAGVRPDQAELPTPCRQWSVRQLINHVVFDVDHFTAIVEGEAFDNSDRDRVGSTWPLAFRSAADRLRSAWHRDGAFDRVVWLPFGEYPATWSMDQQATDFAVHAWDVARATGQSTDLDPEVAALSLAWATQNLLDQFRGDESSGMAFGPEVRAPNDASITDRLAAFFGRDPS